MTKKVTTILLLFTAFATLLPAQSRTSGTVSDKATGHLLEGVYIIIQNKPIGTSTDSIGNFDLSTSEKLPLVIEIQSIGYLTQELRVTERKVTG